jgi:phosphate acetyltransferase
MHTMTHEFLTRHRRAAQAHQGPVVLPEGDDERVLRAAVALVADGLARPVLLGDAETIARAVAALGATLDGITIRDPKTDPGAVLLAQHLIEQLAGRRDGMTEAMALKLVRKPLYFGGMLVSSGAAAAMVAGVANPTRRVIEAASMAIGLADGVPVASSAMVMVVPGREPLLFADCAVNADPTPEQLAGIALVSAATARRLFAAEPRVALLSFSTHGSAQHAAVDKVRAALLLIRAQAPDLAVDGELQADAALSPEIAQRKIKAGSAVAGAANVLIFPTLDAGNIGYKLVQQLAGASAYGPLLQGFAKPVCDLSRGASVDEIITSTVLTLA